jgi:hypothetical protein
MFKQGDDNLKYTYVDEGLLQELIDVVGNDKVYESKLIDSLLINLYAKRISDEFIMFSKRLQITSEEEPTFNIEFNICNIVSMVSIVTVDTGKIMWVVTEKIN